MKPLSLNEMLNLKGGVSVEEYCDTISMLIDNCWDNWTKEQRKAATNAYSKHC